MQPTLVVLAAGIGSRYGGLKQVDGIGPGGEAIIEYSIYDALRAGFGKVVFIIRKSIERDFRDKVGVRIEAQVPVEYVFQELDSPIEGIEKFPVREKPWGTGHAVLVARDVVKTPFAVINADDYYGISGFQRMAEFLSGPCSAEHYAMIGYELGKTVSDFGTVSRGVCSMDPAHFLTSVNERTKIARGDGHIYYEEDGRQIKLADDTLVSMNFWGFHPSVFHYFHEDFVRFVHEHTENPKAEFYIPITVNRLVQEQRVRLSVLASEDHWYGITYQEDKPEVEKAFKVLTSAGKYPLGLWGK
jgi:NDP-sugar pyrophosphorylase family protein